MQVVTPSMVYDFANELTGTFHARQFRFKSEMAAEYISSIIKGKLHRAKQRLMLEGRWAGTVMPPGFMVDNRKVLPNGDKNENWRRFEASHRMQKWPTNTSNSFSRMQAM